MTLGTLDRLRREYGTRNKPFDTNVAVWDEKPVTPADVRRLEDAGATDYTIYPFTYTIGPNTTIAQKRAEMERVAEELIART